jgi:quercetin dioxygenase-like cupin family protein
MRERTIIHPIIKEKITFVRTADETDGNVTDLVVELGPGGGNPAHFHTRFEESFTAMEGTLHLRSGITRRMLQPGETATIPRGTVHSLSNPSDKTIKFRVQVRPGQPGLELFAQIAYGLARDGQATKAGLPKRPSHLALLMEMGDVHVPGPAFKVIAPVLAWLGRRARKRGVERELVERYCT